MCNALCTIVAHNIAQNRPDSFPPYPPDNHHCSDDVYLREGGEQFLRQYSGSLPVQAYLVNSSAKEAITVHYDCILTPMSGLCKYGSCASSQLSATAASLANWYTSRTVNKHFTGSQHKRDANSTKRNWHRNEVHEALTLRKIGSAQQKHLCNFSIMSYEHT